MIKVLNNEGLGISSISRILNIPKTSIQRQLSYISQKITTPVYTKPDQNYEIDELRTYTGNKKSECWIIYAINKANGEVIDYVVGRRTKENLKKVIDTLLNLSPKRIFTDGLNTYPGLIPKPIHRVFKHNTNKIERHNLSMRTHLKRLARKTICYTKNEAMLASCLKIYFWG